MPKVHVMEYGVLEVGTPVHTGRQQYRRKDKYTTQAGESFFEWAFCEANDDGPRWDIQKNYDARCSCCWLGFAHTIKAHERRIG